MSAWVNTRRLRVDLLLTGHRTITGDIHLQPLAAHHTGPETAVDLFNRNEQFFAVTLEGEQPLFLAKSQVVYLKLPPQPPIEDPDRATAARRLDLEVELADGTLLEGLVSLEMPPDRLRILDFLNYAPRFFAVWTPETVRVVNRDHVRAVSPLVDLSRASS
jgi:hypothetical protein